MEGSGTPYRYAATYMAILQATLTDVYHYDRQAVDALVAKVATDLVVTESDDERLLFFHAEPIATAEDLTGKTPTDAMYDQYREILQRFPTWSAA